ncbi:hypothetical protein P7D22_12035 [Lichenihabitans sp. Uapishka_5]|uniref:hypothetical protein n=1 Tax=Lichenihabitans sp. Uapishka_5 TaxID=3037302 RepID=UPI0029E7F3EE|nr:hypothetical protein [Lichenihabitans sp. Uapishka_5]MDX7951900.1 hypothetical protein [Lichenihabitans sp. Uapishka_5]
MDSNDLQVRGRSLEDAFFTRENERLRLGLRADPAAATDLGLADAGAFDRLRDMDVAGDTVAALTLIPVVAIAWADGDLHDKERAALLQAAEAAGIAPGSASHVLLESWLVRRPDPELFERWKSFIVALCADMPPRAVEGLRADLLHRAHAVADAAGGILGFARVSAREREILIELEHAFPA